MKQRSTRQESKGKLRTHYTTHHFHRRGKTEIYQRGTWSRTGPPPKRRHMPPPYSEKTPPDCLITVPLATCPRGQKATNPHSEEPKTAEPSNHGSSSPTCSSVILGSRRARGGLCLSRLDLGTAAWRGLRRHIRASEWSDETHSFSMCLSHTHITLSRVAHIPRLVYTNRRPSINRGGILTWRSRYCPTSDAGRAPSAPLSAHSSR